MLHGAGDLEQGADAGISNGIEPLSPLSTGRDEPAPPQTSQMGRNAALGGADRFDQVGHRSFLLEQEGEEPQAGGITQDTKETGEEISLRKAGSSGNRMCEVLWTGWYSEKISHGGLFQRRYIWIFG